VNDRAAGKTYQVVVNHEEQYSIWDAHREPPDGWRADGFAGVKQECLAHIAEVWTDMRPLSARTGDTVADSLPR
jgi:MbtH protein